MTAPPEASAGSTREVLRIAVPLVLSTASLTVMLFVDRMFLSWYGPSAVAAATPGGITYFTVVCFFMGTAQYVNTLVAQYHGCGNRPACARAVWQGVIFSLASYPLILASIPFGIALLERSGHDPALVKLETDYFSILMLGGVFLPLNAALSSFFSGRGKTRVVMWGNVAANVANAALAYVLVFGKAGFPEMGIRGAGLATAVTGGIPAAGWLILFLGRRYQLHYRTRSAWRFHRETFLLLMRFGVPAGVQFFLDIASLTVFILLIGRLGQTDLAAANICLTLEMVSFLPVVGMSIATSTLVGEYIGRDTPHLAEKSVASSLRLALVYTGAVAVMYLLVPGPLMDVFQSDAHSAQGFAAIREKGVVLLRLIALYTLADAAFLVFSGALKGAGDTHFAMWAQVVAAWIFFVPPVYVIIEHLHWGVYAAWSWALVYVLLLTALFWLRFRSGAWKSIGMTAPTCVAESR